MKSTPLLMKGPLVRATLAGVKTETRRLVTSLNDVGRLTEFCRAPNGWSFDGTHQTWYNAPISEVFARCPYGTPGDCLWIRETWAHLGNGGFGYRADVDAPRDLCWQPSIHMPREACRLELALVSVSIEFIQDITDEAIRAEGVADLTLNDLLEMGTSKKAILAQVAIVHPQSPQLGGWTLYDLLGAWLTFPLKERFQIVWDLIYGADPSTSWSANPPVWVLKYRRVTT